METSFSPLVLIIYDGWGIASPSHGNAVTLSKKPFFNSLITSYPTFSLQASGEVVGLIWGEMGNSEVGHLTLGSGRIIYQSLARINKSIIDGDFNNNPAFLSAENHVKKYNSSLHLLGLVSNGGIHSHQDHLSALLDFCKNKNIRNVFIHAILDGRDTKKDDGINFIKLLVSKIHEIGIGKIASISGRFYAMDRDNHWERIEKAYMAIAEGKSENTSSDPVQLVEKSYENHIYDEEFVPSVIVEENQPVGKISPDDAVIFFNFRPDRARQLTSALTLPGFEKFPRIQYLKNLFFVTFTEYDKGFPVEIAFPTVHVTNTLSQIVSEHGLRQLRIAETEKYAHITYFFNGGAEKAFPNEERILIPSPLAPSYDVKPEMSAYDITRRVVKEISKNIYHFIVINFANADMVGHTGNLQATIKAIQILDECTEKIISIVLEKGGTAIITADHGNAESKVHLETGEILKEHTSNPVPFIFVNKNFRLHSAQIKDEQDLAKMTASGMLADVAPTILKTLKLPIPREMVGNPLL